MVVSPTLGARHRVLVAVLGSVGERRVLTGETGKFGRCKWIPVINPQLMARVSHPHIP